MATEERDRPQAELRWMCISCAELTAIAQAHCASCGRERDPEAEAELSRILATDGGPPQRHQRPIAPWSLLPEGTILRAPQTPVLLRSKGSPISASTDSESSSSSEQSPTATRCAPLESEDTAGKQSLKLSAAAPEFYPPYRYIYYYLVPTGQW